LKEVSDYHLQDTFSKSIQLNEPYLQNPRTKKTLMDFLQS
jgi:hypothetical protein